MNRSVFDPRRIQKAGGALSGCSTIYQDSSSQGAITAIDGAPQCKAEIWGLSTGLEETCAVVVAP